MDATRPDEDLLERLAGAGPVASARIAVVVAHPDDETIGIGGQLARLSDPLVVHVTNGAPRDSKDAIRSGFLTAAAYAQARRRELEAAVTLAGVPVSALVGLGFGDQEAALNLVPLARRLASIFADNDIGHVVTHAYEGGHPDHDATAFAVHQARSLIARRGHRPPPNLYEMPLYASESGGRVAQRFVPDASRPEVTLVLDEAQRRLKRKMLDAHESQRAVTTIFTVDVERFRRAPDYDFTTLPNGGDLFYDRQNWGMTGRRWEELAREALRELEAS
jgi:N-acetylglucosamine malate deacetylase 2